MKMKSSKRALALFIPVGVLLGSGCMKEDLNSTVTLKRGSFIRVINLTSTPAKASSGERYLATYGIENGEAPFVLIPPSSKSLSVQLGSSTLENKLNLKANQSYTFVCINTASGPKCFEFEGDPTHAKDGQANIRILNVTDDNVNVSQPNAISLMPQKGSETITLKALSAKVAGESKAGKSSSSSIELQPNGAYLSVFYVSGGKLNSKTFYSNPPMQAAGMANPNR